VRDFVRRHRVWSAVAALGLVAAIAVVGMGLYLASVAGDLPWQEDPVRIQETITPFAGIEGFSLPTKTPTPIPASPAAGTPIP
jgi:hypothetical protein